MNPEHNNDRLTAARPVLSPEAKAALFARVTAAVAPTPPPVRSPYLAYIRRPVALALAVVLCLTSVTSAAQASRPGDTLFPVEQLSEELRFVLTPAPYKQQVREGFAQQRLREVGHISEAVVAKPLDQRDAAQLSLAVDTLLGELDQIEDAAVRETVAEVLLGTLDPARLKLRVEADRFELRDDTVRVRFKDGEWRYRDGSKKDDDGDDDDDDDKNDRREARDDDDDDDDDELDSAEDSARDSRSTSDFRWSRGETAASRSVEEGSTDDDHSRDDRDDPDDREDRRTEQGEEQSPDDAYEDDAEDGETEREPAESEEDDNDGDDSDRDDDGEDRGEDEDKDDDREED